jgi:hypothetical protein
MSKADRTKEDAIWELAARIERCAIGKRRDAAFYTGRRRDCRIARAEALERRWHRLLGLNA